MAGVPFVFGNATTSIPLSNLDANFNTGLTIGNTTVGLGNTVTTLGNVTLNNVTINSGTSNVSPANVVATTLTIGGVALGAGDSSMLKNRIINGAMVIDQRNAGASVTPTASAYVLDRYRATMTQASKYSVQQDAGAVTPPVGFTDYLGVTSTSAYSVGTTDQFTIDQYVEGYNISDLAWGTANAKTVTLSFWVRSSLTGTFGGAIKNSAQDRCYPYSYTISTANTWEQKSITIAGDTTGTWLTTTGIGMRVGFNLGTGATYQATAGAWTATNFITAPTGAVSVVATSGATFYITGVQLEVGSSATGFEYRIYGTELANCQRYYQQVLSDGTNYAFQLDQTGASGAYPSITLPLQTSMRTVPSAGIVGTITYLNCTFNNISPKVSGALFQTSSTGSARNLAYAGGTGNGYTFSAEL